MAKILIVDDDTDLLDGQRLFLEGKGYDVETAQSLADGIERLASFTPDLILADLMMEHYDSGFVFCKRVRDRPETAKVPIIMQTAAPREVGFTFDASQKAGADWIKVNEVVTKPLPLEDLEGKIRRYLEAE